MIGKHFLFLFLMLSLLPIFTACGGIISPPPEANPAVESTFPADQEQGFVLNKAVSVTFTEKISSGTINGNTFFLEDDLGAKVPGDLTLTENTATFRPTNDFKGSTTFTATVTTGIQDLSGNSLAQSFTWQFTTAPPGSVDNDPPKVFSTDPQNNETNVLVTTDISVTFDESIDQATVTFNTADDTDTFKVNKGTKAIKILVSTGSKTFTFVPDAKLDFDTTFTVTITTGVKDQAGNPLSSDFIWSFTTEKAPPDGDL